MKLHTLKQLQRELSKERFDLTSYKLVIVDYDTEQRSTIDRIDLDKEVREAVIVVRKESA